MRSRLVSPQEAEVQLKRPLGRAAPRLLLRRMNLDPKASVIDAICDATSRRGKVQRRALPRAPAPPPPPTISKPAPRPPAPKVKPAGAVVPDTPPKLPSAIADLDLAVMLLGAFAKGDALRASRLDKLKELVGTVPPSPEAAQRWKIAAKAVRHSAAP